MAVLYNKGGAKKLLRGEAGKKVLGGEKFLVGKKIFMEEGKMFRVGKKICRGVKNF